MENVWLIQLKDTTIIKSSKMEELINKWLELKAKTSWIVEVTDDTIDLSKEVKKEAKATISEIEQERLATGRIIKQVKEEIDAKAIELKKPFQEVQEEIEWKIKKYTEEEEKKKQAEKDRIDLIISEINKFEVEEELKTYYKALDKNDQRKTLIATAGRERKEFIEKLELDKKRNEIKNKIEDENDIEKLENIDLGDFKDELGVLVSNKVNKLKVEQLEAEKKQREDAEKLKKENTEKHIETMHPLTLEQLKNETIQHPADEVDMEKVMNWITMRINTLETVESNKKLKDLEEKNKKLEDEKKIEEKAKELNKKKEEPKKEIKTSQAPNLKKVNEKVDEIVTLVVENYWERIKGVSIEEKRIIIDLK